MVCQQWVTKKTDNVNRPITKSETESVNKLPANKSLGLDGFTGEFYQTCEEEIMLILFKHFQKIKEEAMLPKSFCEVTITLIPKSEKYRTKKGKSQAIIFD